MNTDILHADHNQHSETEVSQSTVHISNKGVTIINSTSCRAFYLANSKAMCCCCR
ncbi:hypothetical protein WAF17_00560 [Bernardetia sp. ABR2-2B]|uniref:hypothetical protein n=1 Tax=Bernardetia sp. ABR2-2B TaxID=3127472 RepID=UPI0030CBBA95